MSADDYTEDDYVLPWNHLEPGDTPKGDGGKQDE